MNSSELQVHVQNGTLDRAAAELAAERERAEAAGKQADAALALNDLGVVYMLQGKFDAGRENFLQAQQQFILLDDAAGQGRAVGNLAQLEQKAGNDDRASGYFLQAADLLHEGGAFEDEYLTRRRLSRYYMTHGASLMALNETARALAVKPNASVWDKIQMWVYRLPLRLLGLSMTG